MKRRTIPRIKRNNDGLMCMNMSVNIVYDVDWLRRL